jgi:hypothetical protein
MYFSRAACMALWFCCWFPIGFYSEGCGLETLCLFCVKAVVACSIQKCTNVQSFLLVLGFNGSFQRTVFFCIKMWVCSHGNDCVCVVGFYGKGCKDACQLNPCENNAQCHRKPSSSHGYICDCGDNHYGQYCQHRSVRQPYIQL